MASTSITTVGGVVVVTQVIPKEESSVQLQDRPAAPPPSTPPGHPAPPGPPASDPVKVDDMTAAFLRGWPLQLGVVQIVIGLMSISFSLTALFWWTLIIHLPFALAFIFIVSGSLAVAAGRRTSVSLVWASLVSHLVSVCVGVAGVVYDCLLMATRTPTNIICLPEDFSQFDDPEEVWVRCTRQMWMLYAVLYGLLGFVLVLLVLQVCVSITVCVFSGKALKLRHTCNKPTSDCRPLLASP